MLDKPASHTSVRATTGPLAGYRIVEFAGIGPGPFACMMLADMGAEVVTLDRVGARKNMKGVAVRGRKVVELDLKDKAAIAQVLDLLTNADALIEGFRPGVMERLGLGPDVVLARNPKLVYGRMTGWGQEGPLAQAAGHDINYIAITRRVGRDRPEGKAGAAAQSRRRFRRRRTLCRGRRTGRAVGSVEIRQGTGGRCRDVRRRGLADVDVLRHDRVGPLGRGPPEQLHRRRRAFLRRVRVFVRPLHFGRLDRAAILRPAAQARGAVRCRLRRADGPQGLARAAARSSARCSRARRARTGAGSWKAPTSALRRS